MPSEVAIGARIGVVMIISGATSMMQPRNNSMMLISRSNRYLLLVIDIKPFAISCGTRR